MIDLLAAWTLALAAAQFPVDTPPDAAWTWTLYADESPVVLANEVPDTAHLRATFECEPGENVTRLTLYGQGAGDGMARLSAGEAAAVAQASATRGGGLKLALPADHPVLAAFAVGGRLMVSVGEHRRTVEVPPSHLAKLRRFAELCSG